MKPGAIGALALALVALGPRLSGAQQPPPLPGPASLSVPHPIPPPASTQATPPRDLYQQLTPPAIPPPIVTPPIYYPGYGYGYGYGYGGYGGYGWPGYLMDSTTQKPAVIPPPAHGSLRLDASPGSSQVYVDGLYVGSVDDFGMSGRALDLEEGAHRVELRAADYAPLSFNVRIAANQTTRFRGDLPRLEPLPAARAATPGLQRTIYIIPNCYAGDRPPLRALPRGCDVAKMIVRKP